MDGQLDAFAKDFVGVLQDYSVSAEQLSAQPSVDSKTFRQH